jgi:undecaprenyldiphospho-muramoylpentapeptide beta-N-acetylglucosaminyltransferase
LVSAGGTGGGVYPALAVIDALGERADVLWVGGLGGMESDLVRRAGISFEAIPAAGVHGVGLQRLPANAWRLGQGILAARRILGQFRPDELFFTGGYIGIPVALAGHRIPKTVFVPDIEPALAMKWIARMADTICVSTTESLKFYEGRERVRVTGYPIRPAFRGLTREEGRRGLGLSPDRPVVLVSGGSRGARSINEAVWRILPGLLMRAQVVHLTGSLDWPRVDGILRTQTGARLDDYHPFPYLHEQMGAALAAADVAVSRAGASVLGEYPHFGLPSILVPYPHAWRYQKVNADHMSERGAAVQLDDAALHEQLWPTLVKLLDSPERLRAMAGAAKGLASQSASSEIAQEIIAVGMREGAPA